jgi:hypothetical protein
MTSDHAALGWLNVRQSEVSSSDTLSPPYDLCIATVSWESRCTATALLLKGANSPCVFLKFLSASSETLKRKDQNYRDMKGVLAGNCSLKELGPSLEFDSNFPQIESLVRDTFARTGRPIRILLDATCMPKRYLLCLIGLGFKREYVCAFDIIYAEGRYDLPTAPRLSRMPIHRGLVSEGEWRSVQVPFFESSDFAAERRDLCISTGAEISVAMPLVERMDARRINVIEILGSDARVPKVAHELAALARIKSESNVTSASFDLHDVIGVAQHIISCREIAMTCMAIGSKPHSIGLAIAGLADDLIEIVCRAPGGYVAGEVKPAGKIFRFSLEDRFEPLSYLNITTTKSDVAGSRPVTGRHKKTGRKGRMPPRDRRHTKD